MRRARKCRCGAEFYSDDRELCMECTLAEKDKERVAHGPDEHKDNPDAIINKHMTGATRPKGSYDDRLALGFRMINGI